MRILYFFCKLSHNDWICCDLAHTETPKHNSRSLSLLIIVIHYNDTSKPAVSYGHSAPSSPLQLPVNATPTLHLTLTPPPKMWLLCSLSCCSYDIVAFWQARRVNCRNGAPSFFVRWALWYSSYGLVIHMIGIKQELSCVVSRFSFMMEERTLFRFLMLVGDLTCSFLAAASRRLQFK
jgi:hypothetical protein